MHDVSAEHVSPLLLFWIAAFTLATVAARDCDLGSLHCASVMGNTVEFCHWDRPRLFKQPEIVCDECRRAAIGDIVGVACNAIALRNWADSEPVWLQAPLFASRDVGLVGHIHYELRRDMFGKITIVGMMEGADLTFQRLKHRDDAMFRSIEVAACFEATITSVAKDGKPIHYTLSGPSKAIELKEPNLWIGAQGFAHLTLRPAKCRLNRGIKEAPPTRPPTPHPVRETSPPPERHPNSPSGPPGPKHDAEYAGNTPPRADSSPHGRPPAAPHDDRRYADGPAPHPDPHYSAQDRVVPHYSDPAGPHREPRYAGSDDLPATGPYEEAGVADDSVELVYPDGHIEVVPEQYVQQHFATAHMPGMGSASQGVAAQGRTPDLDPRPVIVDPAYGVGDLRPMQTRPEHRVGPEAAASAANGDHRIVLPASTAGNGAVRPGPGGAPVAVVPIIYYVTGTDQVLPANTNGYGVSAF